MKHAVRKVVSAEGKETLGYGVFHNYAVEHISEAGSVNIRSCSELDDSRPLYAQNKSIRLLSLHDNQYAANTQAILLSQRKFAP